MSQKQTEFQPKAGYKGKKSAKKGPGGGKFGGGGRDGARDGKFKKRFEGDRPRGDKPEGGDRPRRAWDDKPRQGGKSYGKSGDFKERRPRSEDGGDRPRRAWDDKPRQGGKKPYGKSGDFKERRPRSEDGGDRPRRAWDDKPRQDRDSRGGKPSSGFKSREGREDRPRRAWDDKPRQGGYDKKRAYGDRDNRKPGGGGGWRGKGVVTPREDAREEKAPASAETLQKLKSTRPGYGGPSPAFLFGVHAVKAALLNPARKHHRILCTEDSYESIADACAQAAKEGIALPDITYVDKEDISRLLPRDAVHQGIMLDSVPPEEVFLADIIIAADDNTKVIVLDQVTDPHNVGAILRSASVFGAKAVVVQKLHAPDITGTLAKSASGAVEHVPLVREVNLARALESLKEAGFACYGLDERGGQTLAEVAPTGRVVLVLGAEGKGLRRLVAETCDALVRLPGEGPISSLNVSNAAAVALYELGRK